MLIYFMKQFDDGKPTHFKEKILVGLDKKVDYFSLYNPKLHTMRESFRVKEGMMLDLAYWEGRPYNSSPDRFIIQTPCISTQEVKISWVNSDRKLFIPKNEKRPIPNVDLSIDGIFQSKKQIETLAENDGFNSVDHFFRHFNKSKTYNLIHWTNLKY